MASASPDPQRALLARSWSAAASQYRQYLAPRFLPWVRENLRALSTAGPLPEGLIVLAGCGPAVELPELRSRWPQRQLLGLDLSPGMIEEARMQLPGDAALTLAVADLESPPELPEPVAALLSSFAWQQLRDPLEALERWLQRCAAGSRLALVWWPPLVEEQGPFALLRELLPPRADRPLSLSAAWLEDRGAVLEADCLTRHRIVHPSAATVFDQMVVAGPLRPMLERQGPEAVSQLRERFLERAPAGEWTHWPSARRVLIRSLNV